MSVVVEWTMDRNPAALRQNTEIRRDVLLDLFQNGGREAFDLCAHKESSFYSLRLEDTAQGAAPKERVFWPVE